MKLCEKILRTTLLALIALVLVSGTVLAAYSYYATVQVQETGDNPYDYLPIIADIDNDYLADNGYIGITGLDTRILSGSTPLEHLVTDDKVLFVEPTVAASGTGNYRYTLGNTVDLDDFPVIVGNDGYITITDDDTLDGGAGGMDSFEIEQKGYVNTDAGADKNLVYKEDAFRAYISAEDKISAGFETVTPFSPDAHVEVSSVDGIVKYEDLAGVTWATIHDAANGTHIDDAGTSIVSQIRCDAVADRYDWIVRGFMLFDTSALPDDALVVSATLQGKGNNKGDEKPWGDSLINIYSSNPAGDTSLVVGDYNQVGTTPLATAIAYADFNAAGWNTWTLNSAGLAAISLTDISKFSFREVTYDVGNVAPAWSSGDNLRYYIDCAETANPPVLTVTYLEPSVTATSVASHEYTVKTKAGTTSNLAEGTLLYFPDASDKGVSCGDIYDASAKLWISFWFKLDEDYGAGADDVMYLVNKRTEADAYSLYLKNANGKLYFTNTVGGVEKFGFYSTQASWTGGQWYHVIASMGQAVGGGAASNGARLRIDNGVADTNANAEAIGTTNNFFIGCYTATSGANPFAGSICDFCVGIDDLSAAEETALYNGTPPGGETDFWYIDEGTGANIASYGSGANAGTAGVNTSWITGTRPHTLSISIDGTMEDDARLLGASVPPSASDWLLMQNNVMPYMEYYKHTVDGTLIAWYQPISMIVGTNLDDREGTDIGETGTAEEDGIITWGANPAGIDVTVGSLISSSQPPISPASEEEAIDIVPEGEVPTGGVVNTTNLEDNPLYPIVEVISENTGYTEEQIWFIGATLIILLGMGIAVVRVPNHLLLAGTVGLVLGGFFTAMEIYQWWMMLIFGFVFVMSILMERKPVL